MPGRTIPLAVARQVTAPHALMRRDFAMTAGEEARLLVTVYERDGDTAPLNLTGVRGRFWLSRPGCGAEIFWSVATLVDSAAGQIAADLAIENTRDLGGGYLWGLRLQFPDGLATVARGGARILAAPDVPGLTTGQILVQ